MSLRDLFSPNKIGLWVIKTDTQPKGGERSGLAWSWFVTLVEMNKAILAWSFLDKDYMAGMGYMVHSRHFYLPATCMPSEHIIGHSNVALFLMGSLGQKQKCKLSLQKVIFRLLPRLQLSSHPYRSNCIQSHLADSLGTLPAGGGRTGGAGRGADKFLCLSTRQWYKTYVGDAMIGDCSILFDGSRAGMGYI